MSTIQIHVVIKLDGPIPTLAEELPEPPASTEVSQAIQLARNWELCAKTLLPRAHKIEELGEGENHDTGALRLLVDEEIDILSRVHKLLNCYPGHDTPYALARHYPDPHHLADRARQLRTALGLPPTEGWK